MIRMLIVGYCYGIRFERKLCEEVELRLAYRWFCRLDLDDNCPDHSTFSVNRHGRFRDSKAGRTPDATVHHAVHLHPLEGGRYDRNSETHCDEVECRREARGLVANPRIALHISRSKCVSCGPP